MLNESSIPGTDDWWLVRLANKLGQGLPRMGTIRSYRNGDALLPNNAWDVGVRDSYRKYLKRSRLHIVETVRDARTDKQQVTGFLTGADDDEDGDQEAWKTWTASQMDVQQTDFFQDAGDYGRSYMLIVPVPGERPVWQPRNEWTTISEQNGLRPWLTDAAITVGYDAVTGYEVITLHRPGYFRRAVRRTPIPTLPNTGTEWYVDSAWEWAEDRQPTGVQDALIAQYSIDSDGYGIYEKHLDSVDRINEITLNGLTLIIMQAFHQRGVQGDLPTVYPEGHPHAGQVIDYDELFKAGPAALWTIPMDAKIWESQVSDPRPIYDARRDELKAFMSVTRTPQDIFDGGSQNQSAMGAQISREPLTRAVGKMNNRASGTLQLSQSLSFQLMGDTRRAVREDIQPLFAKIDSATLAERSEAASKFRAGGAPQGYIDREALEMSPQERRRSKAERDDSTFQSALLTGSTQRRVTDTTGGDFVGA